MLLSVRVLKDVASVNSWEPDDQVTWTEGDVVDIYFQLIDASLDTSNQGFHPSGRRYMPVAGATLSCVLENIDDAKVLTRSATQPFAQDPSIWKLQVLATDKVRGSPQMRITLTETGPKITRALIKNVLKIMPLDEFC
jgi:hypothetical protein